MRRFAALYTALDQTTRTSEKVRALRTYLETAPHDDAAWAVALLLGRRPRGSTSSAVLRSLALDATGIPSWLFSECRAAVGDMSEAIALVLPAPRRRLRGGRSSGWRSERDSRSRSG